MGIIFLCSILLFSVVSQAKENVPTVVIEAQDKYATPINPYNTFKSEKVSAEKFSDSQRQNLSDLVKDQIGVDSQTYCANCGAKRLTINGLKGEHTSLLVDGLPLHSAVSSFYGVDNVPILGISDLEVMRGAGSSLSNPEAIGGTLNIITVDPLSAPNTYQTSIGVNDSLYSKSQNHGMLYNLRDSSKTWGVSFGGQYTDGQSWDSDKNGVAEQPEREAHSALIKGRFLLGSKTDLRLRLSQSQLEILGGPSHPSKPNRVRPSAASESDFIDGNINNPFIGDPLAITDWVQLKRQESALSATHYISPEYTFNFKLGHARQQQNSIYQHGFDYSNIDHLVVGDTSIDWAINDSHFFSFGAFFKDQRLRSASATLFAPAGILPKDSFNFNSTALYAQYNWFLEDKLEVNFALRGDQVRVSWLELTNEVKETLVAPRLVILHNFNEHLSQRLSYGLGYRAPLTFFESQHGNNESGYQVDITDLEKAHSIVYSLSYNTPTYYITLGTHFTHLENMAFGFESFGQPILYRNSEHDYDIWVNDLLAGYQVLPWWFVEGSLEFFQYQQGYKRVLPTAAIEKRFQIKSSIESGPWTHLLRANIVGSRDLSSYGSYNDHYQNRNQSAEPLLGSNMRLKKQKAPTWFTIDTNLTYKMKKSLAFTLVINNIFNYTQAGQGDSPATWHWHFNHSHYDGLHTWGPNIGRQYTFSLNGEF